MMHYSKWLIDIKNRAVLQNVLKTARNSDSNRGERVPHVPGDSGSSEGPPPPGEEDNPGLSNHLWMEGYKIIQKIGEGTFSDVVKTQSLKDGKLYACKTMKQSISSVEQANNLREVQAMKRLSPHANIIQLHELIYDTESGTVSLICELMEMNIYEYIQGRKSPLPEQTVKHYMYQLCKSLEHMHSCGIFHRDVKPENILIKQNVLKLGDFGSCRSVYSSPPHTEYISTRWYRAPECLLTDGYYSLKMDIWSAGCVFFEIMSLNPLFPGTNELDQVAKIHEVLGTPDQSILHKFKKSRAMQFNFPQKKGTGLSRLIPNCPAPALSLLYQMLAYDPDERIGADTALRHMYFRETRLSERRAQSLQRGVNVDGLDNMAVQNSLEHLWHPTRLGRVLRGRHPRQTPLSHNLKHVAEPILRRNLPNYSTELPKLSLVVPQISFPRSTMPRSTMPAFTVSHRATLPAITSKKCLPRLTKPRDESHRAAYKTYYMPPVERKRGAY
ncbi:MAPK/MAK/MRK overlapping kinase-like [Eucyclogobius newberryi]|uniref:MAPK/MAK/MRK overlapping kinase-like n=1 Tax=Eucyclogobius newberryi TaxID=166745 RepID=UPI003B5C45A2